MSIDSSSKPFQIVIKLCLYFSLTRSAPVEPQVRTKQASEKQCSSCTLAMHHSSYPQVCLLNLEEFTQILLRISTPLCLEHNPQTVTLRAWYHLFASNQPWVQFIVTIWALLGLQVKTSFYKLSLRAGLQKPNLVSKSKMLFVLLLTSQFDQACPSSSNSKDSPHPTP